MTCFLEGSSHLGIDGGFDAPLPLIGQKRPEQSMIVAQYFTPCIIDLVSEFWELVYGTTHKGIDDFIHSVVFHHPFDELFGDSLTTPGDPAFFAGRPIEPGIEVMDDEADVTGFCDDEAQDLAGISGDDFAVLFIGIGVCDSDDAASEVMFPDSVCVGEVESGRHHFELWEGVHFVEDTGEEERDVLFVPCSDADIGDWD